MKKIVFGISILMFFFVLIFPGTSFQAAKSGLLLWYGTLVPTLFPVMILTHFLLDTNLAYRLTKTIATPFTRLLGLSPYGVYALICGFLCGCPMGAKTLADLRKNNQISQQEAAYLVTFCNNLSPAFLTNFLVLQHLNSQHLLAPTLCILFGAPLLYGLFSNYRFRQNVHDLQTSPESLAASSIDPSREKNKTSATAINFAMVDACITDSIYSITKLGGYVILFAVFSAMIDVLPFQAPLAKAMLAAFTEVSGGIHNIAALSLTFPWKYLCLIAFSAFGGLCCMAQSAQMLTQIGSSLRSYLLAKISVAAIAVIMAVCYVL